MAGSRSPLLDELPAESTSAATIVKRACDQCRRRKIRCDGSSAGQNCANCASVDFECTYNEPPQKRGPRGKSGRVIDELRQTQALRPMYDNEPMANQLSNSNRLPVCIYPSPPIWDRIEPTNLLGPVDGDLQGYGLTLSLAAYSLINATNSGSGNPASLSRQITWAEQLLQEAAALYMDVDGGSDDRSSSTSSPSSLSSSSTEQTSVTAIITSIVLFHCFLRLSKPTKAWFFLHQATMLAWAAGLHKTSSYETLEPGDREQQQYLYRLLFVTERAQALERRFVPTLPLTARLLNPGPESLSAGPHASLCKLTQLYLACGDSIFDWVSGNDNQSVTSSTLVQLHTCIRQAYTAPVEPDDIFAVDLLCTQLWLEIIVWEVALRRGFLGYTSIHAVLHFHFPVQIVQNVIQAMEPFPTSTLATHGIILSEKILHIACAFLDVIQCVSPDQIQPDWEPRSLLERLKDLLDHSYGGRLGSHAQLLESKMLSLSYPFLPVTGLG